jgi:hypothetical protein
MIASAGRERADGLVHAWATHQGMPARMLDDKNDLSLGETGLYYAAADDMLYGRVWVTMARTRNASPEDLDLYRRMLATLNDTHVGGLYDRADGYFVLNEERGGYYLVRKFAVPHTTPESLIRDMERMQAVAAPWTTKWFVEVALILHGKRKPPDRRVTLDD